LFPIDWPEPFGLVMAEAMATGTPVIAFRAGSVPEVVENGVTGFVCDTFHAMAEAIPRVKELDRRACRAHVERRFSPRVMADGYERAYAAVTAATCPPPAETGPQRGATAAGAPAFVPPRDDGGLTVHP
jgi:glycosyltransferase involved in cell wall biosynthesis